MSAFVTRDGSAWTPQYVTGLDEESCIGCGRCYKVCAQGVFNLVERECDDDDDDEDDEQMMVMAVENEGACIGCGACARVCPKNCHEHQSADTLAA